MDHPTAEELYRRALAMNKEAFQAGLLDGAYHALMAALHFAEFIGEDQPLLDISRLAKEQLAWIDKNRPEYEHSTQSAEKRHIGVSIYSHLASQADTMVKMRRINRKKPN